jgi:lysozyme family protein
MAKIEPFIPKILAFEGGFVSDPDDSGGATNLGVTLSTWKKVGYDKDADGDIDCEDIRKLLPEDAIAVLRSCYWNRWKADQIKSQSVAEILVDWLWCSGKWGIVIPQRLLKVPDDGMVGMATLYALNGANPRGLHEAIFRLRESFIQDLVRAHPSQKKFLAGWMNRLNTFKFVS